jgi:hypothetical protein
MTPENGEDFAKTQHGVKRSAHQRSGRKMSEQYDCVHRRMGITTISLYYDEHKINSVSLETQMPPCSPLMIAWTYST